MNTEDILKELFLQQEISLEQYLKYSENQLITEQVRKILNKYNLLIDNLN